MVRLVRIQSRQHSIGYGLRGNRACCYQYDFSRLRGRAVRDVLCLHLDEEVGRELYREWFPGRLGCNHVSLLLGESLAGGCSTGVEHLC